MWLFSHTLQLLNKQPFNPAFHITKAFCLSLCSKIATTYFLPAPCDLFVSSSMYILIISAAFIDFHASISNAMFPKSLIFTYFASTSKTEFMNF